MSTSSEKNEDDVVFETEGESGGFSTSAEKKLREKLKKAVSEKQEYLDGWQRAQADLVNARKGFEEDRVKYVQFANEGIVSELIGVLDSFDMAFSNKEAWENVDKNWRVGVEHIYNQFKNVLLSNGVEVIDATNVEFDSAIHEAQSTIDTADEGKSGMVESIVQKGYILNGRIIRPARVVVYEHVDSGAK